MGPIPDLHPVLVISGRICCIGILLQAIEVISLGPELRNGCLLGWHGGWSAPNYFRRLMQQAQGYPVNLLVLLWRILAASVLLVRPGFGAGVGAFLWATLFASQLHFNRGARLFFANSDHMNLVCLAGLAVAALPGMSTTVRSSALVFIAFQACLGYVASGFEKLRSLHWRSGLRLKYVLQDGSHHIPAVGAYIGQRNSLAKFLAWSVIFLEVMFPLCLFLPEAGFWGFICAGLLFHASIAVLMGLPGFFWAFAATYPALYFVHAWLTAPPQ
jgi:hypothetical protein